MKSQDVKYIKVKLLRLKYRWVARLPEIKLFLSSMTFSCCIQRYVCPLPTWLLSNVCVSPLGFPPGYTFCTWPQEHTLVSP